MKNVGLIGISVAAAALIMAGCGSSSSSTPTGSAPAEVTKPAEMNITQAQRAITEGSQGPMLLSASTQMSAKLNSIKNMAAHMITQSQFNGSESFTIDCDVSGSYTVKTEWTYNDGASPSYTFNESCVMNQCKTDGSSLGPQFYDYCMPEPMVYLATAATGVNTYTLSGSTSVVGNTYYDSDKNVSGVETTVTYDNFKASGENNETNWTLNVDYNLASTFKLSGDGTNFFYLSSDKPSASMLQSFNGHMKEYETDDSGTQGMGMYMEGNFKMTEDGYLDDSKLTTVYDGYMAYYNIDGPESNTTLVGAGYYNNFTTVETSAGAEYNTTVSGTLGSTCLGGSVTVTTDSTMQNNDILYQGDLPFTGKLTLQAASTATVTFDVNASNYTKAKISASDGNATFGSWNSLYDYSCVSN